MFDPFRKGTATKPKRRVKRFFLLSWLLPPSLFINYNNNLTVQADELEEAFAELILEYKHDVSTQPAEDGTDDSRLLLPAERLTTWAPVQKMLRSGAAVEDDIAAALVRAQEASFHKAGEDGNGKAYMDFVGFLKFIHSLDLEVNSELGEMGVIIFLLEKAGQGGEGKEGRRT